MKNKSANHAAVCLQYCTATNQQTKCYRHSMVDNIYLLNTVWSWKVHAISTSQQMSTEQSISTPGWSTVKTLMVWCLQILRFCIWIYFCSSYSYFHGFRSH